jgi:hypothetical protein
VYPLAIGNLCGAAGALLVVGLGGLTPRLCASLPLMLVTKALSSIAFGVNNSVGVAAVPSVRRCCEKWVGMNRCRCGAKLLLSLGGCRGQLVGARLLRDLWTICGRPLQKDFLFTRQSLSTVRKSQGRATRNSSFSRC